MHLARVAALALVTDALVIGGGGPATADPGVSTNVGGSVEAGRLSAHASYRQTTEPVEAVEDDAPAAQPVADSGDAPVPATQCDVHLVGVPDGVAQFGWVCPNGSGGWGPVQIGDLMGGPPTTAAGFGSVAVDAATLAQFAMTKLALPTPAVRMNPDDEQVVQLPSLLEDPASARMLQAVTTSIRTNVAVRRRWCTTNAEGVCDVEAGTF